MSEDSKDKTGISTAVDQNLSDADQAGPGWSGQQLSLLPSVALADDPNRESAGKRGKGRPPGSQNKKTLDWAKYIGSRYTNPLIFLAECYNRPAKELALELGCTTEKAFAFQMAAATKLTEYTNQKMPTTVDLAVDGDVALVIQTTWQDPNQVPGGQGDDAGDLGGLMINIPDAEVLENTGDQTQDVVFDDDKTEQD